MRYVVGFMFSTSRDQVALIRKNRPAWQEGKWNGIGGHIEPGEQAQAAVAREFYEESGVRTDKESWDFFAHLLAQDGAEVYFFRTFSDSIYKIFTCTDELVGIHDIEIPGTDSAFGSELIPNLHWLIPMALSEAPGAPFTIQEGTPKGIIRFAPAVVEDPVLD